MEGPIRTIFSVCLLIMWGLFAAGLLYGHWTGTLWVLLIAAHLTCAVVFRNFAYVFTYGYALSMLILHLIILVRIPTTAGLVIGSVGVLYGARLGYFIWRRYQNPSYAHIKARSDKADANVPLPARLFLWAAVSWLMTFGAMPAYHIAMSGRMSAGILAGVILALAGIVLEAVADHQKQAAKARAPGAFVTAGLYQHARHPNFAGEILFQIGLITALVAAAPNWFALVSGIVAPLYIAVLMVTEARKYDRDQAARYGADPAYQSYRERSSLLLPGI